MTAQPSFQVRVGSLRFNPEDPASQLGRGHFGVVFVGRHGDGGEACAVKRMDRLRFEAEGGLKEIEALRHAQVSTMITIRIVCIQLSETAPSVYQRMPYAAERC